MIREFADRKSRANFGLILGQIPGNCLRRTNDDEPEAFIRSPEAIGDRPLITGSLDGRYEVISDEAILRAISE